MADRSRAAFGLVMALAALAISSCGSTNTSTTSSHATGSGALATRARFIAQASAICKRVRARQQPLKAREESLKGLPASSADEAFVALARQAAAIARTADRQLRAIPQPPADAQTIEQLLEAYSNQAADASNIAIAAAHQENTLGEAAAGALARSISVYSASAQRFGIGGCFGAE